MKLLVTGAKGQLGTELLLQLRNGKSALGALPEALLGAEVAGVDLEDGDLAEASVARALIEKTRPDAVINCAAFTQVDACESETDAAFRANALAPRNLAIACEEKGVKLLHISTDYVFSGAAEAPMRETDLPAPQSAYGATKLLGEVYVRQFSNRWFIVRTAWLYGRTGGNFVKTILRIAKEKGEVNVVDDQVGNPTNAEDLAHHILQIVATEEYGLYHCTGGGICSWYEFAKEIVRLSGLSAHVAPIATKDFKRPARRPAYSALDHTMLRLTVGDKMRPWHEALEDYMAQLPRE